MAKVRVPVAGIVTPGLALLFFSLALPPAMQPTAAEQSAVVKPDERAAAEAISRPGVIVFPYPSRIEVEERRDYRPLGPDEARALDRLPHIETLIVDAPRRLDEWLSLAPRLRGLKHLSLRGRIVDNEQSNLSRSHWDAILQLKSLETLQLWDFSATDADLQRLGKLGGLRNLEICWAKLSPAAFAAIAQFPELRRLKLDASRAKADADGRRRLPPDWRSLATLSHLEEIDLGRLDLTAADIPGIELLPALRTLRLDMHEVDDSAIEALILCPKLETLTLICNRIAGRGLAGLRAAETLKTVALGCDQDLGADDLRFLLDYAPPNKRVICVNTSLALADLAKTLPGPVVHLVAQAHEKYLGPKKLQISTTSRTVKTFRSAVDDDCMAAIGGMRELQTLSLTRHPKTGSALAVTPRGLQHLAGLPKLEAVTLGLGAPLDDDSLEVLGSLPSLQNVTLDGVSLRQEGLAWVGSAAALRTLTIEGGEVDGDALAGLQKLAQPLDQLTLRRVALTGPRLQALAGAAVQALRLDECGVGDDDLRDIGRCARLEHLAIAGASVTDRGLDPLVGLKALRSLRIATSGAITLQGLRGLGGLPVLSFIDIVGGERLESEALAVEFGWTFQGDCDCSCMDTTPPRLLRVGADEIDRGRLVPKIDKDDCAREAVGVRLRGPMNLETLEVHADDIPFTVKDIHLNDCQIGELILFGIDLPEKVSCWGRSRLGKTTLRAPLPASEKTRDGGHSGREH